MQDITIYLIIPFFQCTIHHLNNDFAFLAVQLIRIVKELRRWLCLHTIDCAIFSEMKKTVKIIFDPIYSQKRFLGRGSATRNF